MSNRAHMWIVVMILMIIGLSIFFYKCWVLNFPIMPGKSVSVWEVEVEIEFVADEGVSPNNVAVSLAIPEQHSRFKIVDYFYTSPGYVFNKNSIEGCDRAEWVRTGVEGKQTLYYKIKVKDNEEYGKNASAKMSSCEVADLKKRGSNFFPEMSGSSGLAALSIIEQAKKMSAGSESSISSDVSDVVNIVKIITQDVTNPDTKLLISGKQGRYHANLLMQILNIMEKKVRIVRGVYLEKTGRTQELVEMVEVFMDKGKWIMINPESGEVGVPNNFLSWQRGGVSLLDVVGGHDSHVSFSVISRTIPQNDLVVQDNQTYHSTFMDFSLYSLPIEEQNAYRYILLIPIGSFIVVLMRIFVGVRTSGTFMPVLIALAFLQTKLVPGLLMFLTIISIGLWIRYFLSRHNLLLVARISAVMIAVIGIMVTMSILSYKFGFREIMTVTFFPMIILTWTIERMSILWEEQGLRDVIITGGGSLLIAIMSYFAMTNIYVKYFTFTFPELLLIVLGLTLLIGQYTGYRLLELRRFKTLVGS